MKSNAPVIFSANPNYGLMTRLYFALDVSSGTFSKNNVYVPNLPYKLY
ncbi:MAG: hypothetical protein L3J35_04900 [Bacteroidales bacterium]|nr:hypothetical protein [Bacteroidales bacterium]